MSTLVELTHLETQFTYMELAREDIRVDHSAVWFTGYRYKALEKVHLLLHGNTLCLVYQGRVKFS